MLYKKIYKIIVWPLLASLLLFHGVVSAIQVTPIPLGGLGRFDGLKLRDVIDNDRRIATPIDLLVPLENRDCFDEIVEKFPALSINNDKSLTTRLNGLKENNFREGFFSLTPAGVFHIVYQCELVRAKNKVYVLVTNAPDEEVFPSALLDWFWVVKAKEHTIIRIMPNDTRVNVTEADLQAASQKSGFASNIPENDKLLSRLWLCRSFGPGVKPSDYEMYFNIQGDFVLKNVQERLQGRYTQDKKRVDVTLKPTPTRTEHAWNIMVLDWSVLTEQKFVTKLWDKRMKANYSLSCTADKNYVSDKSSRF